MTSFCVLTSMFPSPLGGMGSGVLRKPGSVKYRALGVPMPVQLRALRGGSRPPVLGRPHLRTSASPEPPRRPHGGPLRRRPAAHGPRTSCNATVLNTCSGARAAQILGTQADFRPKRANPGRNRPTLATPGVEIGRTGAELRQIRSTSGQGAHSANLG